MGGWRRMEGGGGESGMVVVVAVDATKEITNYALEWAIRNVVRPMDTLILMALLRSSSGKQQLQALASDSMNHSSVHQFLISLLKKFGLRNGSEKNKKRSTGGSSTVSSSSSKASSMDGKEEGTIRINEVCVEMMNELCWANNVKNVQTQVKLLYNAKIGSIAHKAEKYGASWVILDRRLKKESENCLKRLECNIILVDHAIPKILQLVNQAATEDQESYTMDVLPLRHQKDEAASPMSSRKSSNTSNNSTSLGWSTDQDATAAVRQIVPSPGLPVYRNKAVPPMPKGSQPPEESLSKFNNHHASPRPPISRKGGVNKNVGLTQEEPATPGRWSMDSALNRRANKMSATPLSTTQDILATPSINRPFKDANGGNPGPPIDRTSSIRRAISLSMKNPPTPPPLCSVCKHSAPVFGKPPKKFSHCEMEKATDGFSPTNFLAEGGYGPVYRGVLADGQVVAVKKHRVVSAQGAAEFCAEVEVLSCAQHRNLVMLVGYCIKKEWLLVYEFACNGSLDKHLHGNEMKDVMAWHHRQKVAVGAARGLRYLHEDCRVGCIIHRDLRPNNILLTHDFEPMVGDFGLARRQMDGQSAEETRVVGSFGYLAPEYTQTGQITEKADVYAFGVLLMELISGLKALDLIRCMEQKHLPQWGTALIERLTMQELIDPRLNGDYVEREVECMLHAASLCLSADSEMRPRMSKVLRMLEGDMLNYNGPHYHARKPTNPVSSPRSISGPLDVTPTRITQSSHTPMHTKSSNPLHSESSIEHKRYSPLVNEQLQNIRDIKPTPSPQTSTVKDELGKESNRQILHQDEHSTSKEYQAYLQGSFVEFMRMTKGISS